MLSILLFSVTREFYIFKLQTEKQMKSKIDDVSTERVKNFPEDENDVVTEKKSTLMHL